jgi:hypothetical protein
MSNAAPEFLIDSDYTHTHTHTHTIIGESQAEEMPIELYMGDEPNARASALALLMV